MKRIETLDGLRGVAVALVVAYHAFGVVAPAGQFERVLRACTDSGWIGVDLFFVLSGFLITGILCDTRGRAGFFRNFFARRALRILPLYYATLALLLLVIAPDVLGARAPLYWAQLSNFAIASGWNPDLRFNIQWSLAVEEQFYLAWPFVVALLSRRRLLQLCVTIVILAPIIRAIMVISGSLPAAVYVLTWCRMDTLATGATVALLARRPGGLSPLLPAARWLALGGGTSILAIGLANRGLHYFNSTVQIVGFSALALTFGSVLVLAVAGSPTDRLARLLTWRPLPALGTVSYGVYLLHPIVREALSAGVYGPDRWVFVAGSRLPSLVLFASMVLAASFATAWLSWRMFERHCLSLKRFFEAGEPQGRYEDRRPLPNRATAA